MAGKSPVRVSEAQGLALQLLAHSADRREADRREADRARAILLTLNGWTSADLVEVFGVREDMVRFWRGGFMRDGIDAEGWPRTRRAAREGRGRGSRRHAAARGARRRSGELDDFAPDRRGRAARGHHGQPLSECGVGARVGNKNL